MTVKEIDEYSRPGRSNTITTPEALFTLLHQSLNIPNHTQRNVKLYFTKIILSIMSYQSHCVLALHQNVDNFIDVIDWLQSLNLFKTKMSVRHQQHQYYLVLCRPCCCCQLYFLQNIHKIYTKYTKWWCGMLFGLENLHSPGLLDKPWWDDSNFFFFTFLLKEITLLCSSLQCWLLKWSSWHCLN